MIEKEKKKAKEHFGFVDLTRQYLTVFDYVIKFIKSLNIDNYIIVRSGDCYFQDRLADLVCTEYSLNFAKRLYLPMLVSDYSFVDDANTIKRITNSGTLKKYMPNVKVSGEFAKCLGNVDYKTLQKVNDSKNIDSDVIPIIVFPNGNIRKTIWLWNSRQDTSILEVSGENINFIDNIL